jgi:hypothetical protein
MFLDPRLSSSPPCCNESGEFILFYSISFRCGLLILRLLGITTRIVEWALFSLLIWRFDGIRMLVLVSVHSHRFMEFFMGYYITLVIRKHFLSRTLELVLERNRTAPVCRTHMPILSR